jgi:hypothetical protein
LQRDGVNDFVVGSRHVAPSLVWYWRQPGGWHRYVIEPDLFSLEAGGTFHYIDRDGDLDLVMGEDSTGNAVYWWQIPYPEYDQNVDWPRFVVKAAGSAKHHDQVFGDFDADGEAELAFWNQGARTRYGMSNSVSFCPATALPSLFQCES